MATYPTPGGDVDTWGPELNEKIAQVEQKADDATNLATSAHAMATLVANAPGQATQAALDAAAAAVAAASTAAASAAEAASSAADALAAAGSVDDAALPPGGTVDQVLTKMSSTDGDADWADAQGLVTSVNGETGAVDISAADVGALPDTYEPPVTSVNGKDGGAVTLTADDVDAVATADLDTLVAANATVAANTAARHTHSNSAVLAATTASFLTADETKLDGIEAAADVTDATNVNAAGAVMNSDTTTASMSFVVDEDDFASDSATKVPTQQSTKAYFTGVIAAKADKTVVTQRVVWTGSAWPALPVHSTPMELWSTDDPDADVPDDANLLMGDVWKRHPAAV